jgi:hypothetical protein
MIPINKGDQKRQASVAGEEKVVPAKDSAKNCVSEKIGRYQGMSRELADMGETDKDGTDNYENSSALYGKRRAVDIFKNYDDA